MGCHNVAQLVMLESTLTCAGISGLEKKAQWIAAAVAQLRESPGRALTAEELESLIG